ncbi:MAG: response regulator transcription factor [Anaerolineae bacterium]|nr:response regulator transcription factor [Anaerolineae bacterium]
MGYKKISRLVENLTSPSPNRVRSANDKFHLGETKIARFSVQKSPNLVWVSRGEKRYNRSVSKHVWKVAERKPKNEETGTMTSVFIISDHAIFGQGLENLLREETVVDIAGQATGVTQGIEQIKGLQPDIVIIDTNGPPNDSAATIMRILMEMPNVKVISLSLHHNKFYIFRALLGIVTSPRDLVKAVEQDVLFLNQLNYGSSPTD